MADAVIIGGGASGLTAAAVCASRGLDTVLIEKMPVCAKKVRITGKGRCNVTNACFDLQELIANVPRNGRFLYSAFSRFMPYDTIRFFEDELGVPLFIHRQNMTTPTDAGALLYEKGRLLLMEALRTRELVSGEVPGKGNIRVGTSCKRGFQLQVSNLMAKFVQTYPGVFLDLNDASPEYIKDELMRHNLDAGIIVEPMNSSLPTFDTRVLSRGDYRVR